MPEVMPHTAVVGEARLCYGGLVHCALDRVAPGAGAGGGCGVTGVGTGCLAQQAALMRAAEVPGKSIICSPGRDRLIGQLGCCGLQPPAVADA